jgi:hypothetical protein
MQLNPPLLALQLVEAHWSNSATAETAALDQVQAFLIPEDPRAQRAACLVWEGVTLAASTLQIMAVLRGQRPQIWTLGREFAHRTDTETCKAVLAAIEAELNCPGAGVEIVNDQIAGRNAEQTFAIVREALWLAATMDSRCDLVF